MATTSTEKLATLLENGKYMNVTRLNAEDKQRLRNEFEKRLFSYYANRRGLERRVMVNAHELGYVVLAIGCSGWTTTWFDNIITID